MANLSSTVKAPRLVGAGLGLQLAGLDKPLPLLVHNLGWSSSASFQSPKRRTCCKGFPETGSEGTDCHHVRRLGEHRALLITTPVSVVIGQIP